MCLFATHVSSSITRSGSNSPGYQNLNISVISSVLLLIPVSSCPSISVQNLQKGDVPDLGWQHVLEHVRNQQSAAGVAPFQGHLKGCREAAPQFVQNRICAGILRGVAWDQ